MSKYGTDSTGKSRSLSDALKELETQYGTGTNAGKLGMDEETYNSLRKNLYEKEYTPSSFDMGEFEGLLGKLKDAKMSQVRQKSVEGRRDIMAGGLAGMMGNF